MRSLLLAALLALAAGCATPATEPSPPSPSAAASPEWAWEERSPAPAILAETAVAEAEGTFYIVGGWTEAGGGSPRVFAYDAVADAWATLPPYPLPVHHAQAAVVDGTLYVFGGAVTQALLPGTLTGVGPRGWPITDASFRLGPGAQTWEPIAPLPEARGLGGAAVHEGLVYLVGGVGLGGDYLDATLVYDPASDSYADAAPLPTTRDHLSVVAHESRIYAMVGRSNAGGAWDDIETVEALDVASGTWTRLADAPLGRGGQGAGVLADGRIALVGGERAEGEFTVFDAAHAYDPATDTWSEIPLLPEPRHGMAMGSWDGTLYVMGGALIEGSIESSTLALATKAK